ncbi:reverse transcriptase domain, reverse transcriptase zinc-binding domain protein, partial [Tanacetum coccineum]
MEISRGCNASFVTMIPKVADPIGLGDYRPISLIGCYYKIIAKMLAERVKRVVGDVVGEVQNAFIKGRYILDGVLIANETMEFLKKKKRKGLIFKVDFEKAYDSINWRFLLGIMRRMGFGNKWIRWVDTCLRSASMSILVNGSPSEEFGLERGVRQGDPLSPFLFILAAEGLNAIVSEAVEKGIFRGVVVGDNNVMVPHLQYADDTIFFGDWDKDNAKSLMCILKCFEEASGLKVNYNKSKIYGIGINDEEMTEMARWMGCGIGDFPFTNLGLPIGENMRRVKAWGPANIGKIGSWGGIWRDIVKIGEEIDGVGVEFTSSLGGLRDGKDIIFWVGRWVDDRRLFDRFSSVYHLDRRKESIVWEKGSWDNNVWCWEWDWIREIRGRVSKEFEDLLGVLRNVVIHNNCKDNWRWSLGEDGNFAVKDLSRMVEEKILHADSGGQETIWNSSLVDLFPSDVLFGLPDTSFEKKGMHASENFFLRGQLDFSVRITAAALSVSVGTYYVNMDGYMSILCVSCPFAFCPFWMTEYSSLVDLFPSDVLGY